MYQQTLYKVITPIKTNTIKRLNKLKKWEYGYNKENDVIVISKTGQIGEIYEIQNLKIALPEPENIYKRSNKKKEQDAGTDTRDPKKKTMSGQVATSPEMNPKVDYKY